MGPILVCLFGLFLSACGGSYSSGSSATNSTYQNINTATWNTGANVGFYLTDQTASYEKVVVTVTEVDVNSSSSDGETSTGWQKFALQTPVQIDLLAFQSGATKLLNSIKLPTGTYQQIRLLLSTTCGDNYVVVKGTQYNLTVPSGAETGLKIKNVNLTVDANSQVAVVLDFLLDKSIKVRGSSKIPSKPTEANPKASGNSGRYGDCASPYLLRPVINANIGKATRNDDKVETETEGTSDPGKDSETEDS